jgi:galactonate dehydratase
MEERTNGVGRRAWLQGMLGAAGAGALAGWPLPADGAPSREDEPVEGQIRITKLETYLVKPRWLFLEVHTDAGLVGLGEPITEGRAKTCAAAVQEIASYLVGKDPRRVVHQSGAVGHQGQGPRRPGV